MKMIELRSARGAQARIDCIRENIKTVKCWMSNGSTVFIENKEYTDFAEVEAYIVAQRDGRHLRRSSVELEQE